MNLSQSRIQQLYDTHYLNAVKKVDQSFAFLFVGQWLLGIAMALWVRDSPSYVTIATSFGGALAFVPSYLIRRSPGAPANRYVVTVAQTSFSAFFIWVSEGQLGTHFHIFGSLAFLAFYRDWRVLALATALTTIEWTVGGRLWPEIAYNALAAGPWRPAVHAAWLIFENVILYYATRHVTRQLWSLCAHQVRLEETVSHIEELVEERTRQLQESQRTILSQQNALVSAAKMSALGEMAGGLAHEINNPLAIIRNCSEQLQEMVGESTLDAAGIRRMASMMMRTGERIAKIVQGMRSFSRDGSRDQYLEVAVDALINDAVGLCGERFKAHGIALEVESFDQKLSLEVRESEICQVLLNLLNNAFDAVEPLSEPWVRISVRDAGEHVELRVTDSGRTIPPELQKKIFEPFFTTKEVGRGTGMGLSISLGLVRNHGGHLTVDARSETTCFVLSLPRRHPKTSTSGAA